METEGIQILSIVQIQRRVNVHGHTVDEPYLNREQQIFPIH